MKNIKITLFTVLLPFCSNVSAEVYFHVSGGLDYVLHEKSDKDYPLLNLKGGVGYQVTPKLGVEFDITAKSTTGLDSSGTCTTTVNTQVSCTKKEEISRFMAVASGVYTHNIANLGLFAKAGLSFVSSSFNSYFEGDQFAKTTIADESHYGISGIASAGVIFSEKHRVGAILSTKYGDSGIGKFNYFGIEYSYLIAL